MPGVIKRKNSFLRLKRQFETPAETPFGTPTTPFKKLAPRAKETNVETAIRIKPSQNLSIQNDANTLTIDDKSFAFDHVFGPESKGKEIFETFGQTLVDSSLNGFNCCLFCYGQTGSGKSYTMFNQTDGLVKKFCQQVLDCGGKIKFSFIEIHKENVYDLLSLKVEKMEVKENVKSKIFYVQGCVEKECKTYEQIAELILRGQIISMRYFHTGNEIF